MKTYHIKCNAFELKFHRENNRTTYEFINLNTGIIQPGNLRYRAFNGNDVLSVSHMEINDNMTYFPGTSDTRPSQWEPQYRTEIDRIFTRRLESVIQFANTHGGGLISGKKRKHLPDWF